MTHSSDSSDRTGPTDQRSDWLVFAALALIVGLAFGWFLLSWGVVGEAPGDAAGEAVGVAFGLLIVFSIIGAALNRRRGR